MQSTDPEEAFERLLDQVRASERALSAQLEQAGFPHDRVIAVDHLDIASGSLNMMVDLSVRHMSGRWRFAVADSVWGSAEDEDGFEYWGPRLPLTSCLAFPAALLAMNLPTAVDTVTRAIVDFRQGQHDASA